MDVKSLFICRSLVGGNGNEGQTNTLKASANLLNPPAPIFSNGSTNTALKVSKGDVHYLFWLRGFISLFVKTPIRAKIEYLVAWKIKYYDKRYEDCKNEQINPTRNGFYALLRLYKPCRTEKISEQGPIEVQARFFGKD